jgi:uncharacterized protein YndB with AHSA1/START domain
VSEEVRTRAVASSPDEVWAALADFDGISAWAANVDHSCYLDEVPRDTDRSGALVGVARRVQSGRFVLVERVTVWEPGERLAYEITGLPKVMRTVVNEWRLAARPDGGTDIALVTQVDCGPRPPHQLIARIAARRLAKASDTMLDGLTDLLRHRPGASPLHLGSDPRCNTDESLDTGGHHEPS